MSGGRGFGISDFSQMGSFQRGAWTPRECVKPEDMSHLWAWKPSKLDTSPGDAVLLARGSKQAKASESLLLNVRLADLHK